MSKLKKNLIYNLVGQFIVLILSFISVKYIHKQLGPDALGLIFFTAMINMILATSIQSGMSTTTVREISGYYESDKQYVHDYIRTSTTLYWSLYFLVSFCILLFAPWFVENWINLESMDKTTATHILRVLGITSVIVLPRSLYISMLRGIERMGSTNTIDVITTALQHFGTIILILQKFHIYTIIYWYSFCYILRIFIYILVCLKFFRINMLRPGFRVYVIKRNAVFTSRLMFATILGTVIKNIDKLIISKLLPVAAVGYYGFLFTGLGRVRLFTGAISQAAYPSLSKLFKKGKQEAMRKQYTKLLDIITFVTIPIFAMVIFGCEPGLSFIFDPETALNLFLPTLILCIGLYINAVLTMPYIFSLAVGNSGISAKQQIINIILYPGIAFLLIRQFSLLGASIAYVCLVTMNVFYSARRVHKECLHQSFLAFILQQFKVLLLALMTYGTTFKIIVYYQAKSDIFILAQGYFITSMIFLAIGYFLISEEMKHEIVNLTKKYIHLPTQIGK